MAHNPVQDDTLNLIVISLQSPLIWTSSPVFVFCDLDNFEECPSAGFLMMFLFSALYLEAYGVILPIIGGAKASPLAKEFSAGFSAVKLCLLAG